MSVAWAIPAAGAVGPAAAGRVNCSFFRMLFFIENYGVFQTVCAVCGEKFFLFGPEIS